MNIRLSPSRFIKNRPSFFRPLLGALGVAVLLGVPAARGQEFSDIIVDDTAEIGWLTLDHDIDLPGGLVRLGTSFGSGPAVDFTSYDDWVQFNAYADEVNWYWREGQGDSAVNQMTLDPSGNLTVYEPISGSILVLDPGDGIIGNPEGPLTLSASDTLLLAGSQVSLGTNGVLTLTDPVSSHTIVLDPGNETVTVGGTVLGGSVTNNYYLDPTGFSVNGTTGAVELGLSANASNTNSFAIGDHAAASGVGALALGNSTASGAGAFALGSNATASGTNSFAFGSGNTVASSVDSIVLGTNITAQSWSSVTVGHFSAPISGNTTAWASGDPAFIVGIGQNSSATANGLVVLNNGAFYSGTGNYSSGDVGFNIPTRAGTYLAWIPQCGDFAAGQINSGTILGYYGEVGIGAGITIFGQGVVGLGAGVTAQGQGSVAMGYASGISSAAYEGGVSIGSLNYTGGQGAITMGFYNQTYGTDAVAIGGNNSASSFGSIALGSNNSVIGVGSIAMGNNTVILGAAYGNATFDNGSLAMGNDVYVAGDGAVALGDHATANLTIGGGQPTGAAAIGDYVSADGREV